MNQSSKKHQKLCFDFEATGIGIAEISHRSKEFTAFVKKTETLIRTQLNVPSTHHVLFTQGGGTGQFSAVPVLDYVLTGSWSKKASEEARRLGGSRCKTFTRIPAHSEYTFSPDPAQSMASSSHMTASSPASFPFDRLPTDTLLPLVADYSSSFMSRPIPRLADHALIFAGAQKNIGPAGLTILIVRNDCLVDVDAAAALGAAPVPVSMAYKTIADAGSLYNTPSRSQKLGGVEYYGQVNKRKAENIYDALRDGEAKGVYRAKVEQGSGSWMNVVFDVLGDGAEAKFIAGAEQQGMKALKGHRSVGGIRVSLYNAITEEQTDRIVTYMRQFSI
ncbi:pyridoxal phosphate-dependent transferase [Desarmillaria tabescens]|uniref:phosphoserine transaminase n=1 Tax=Armillaria tabescens TaxID=1929756 RepID=A0AA39N6W3_ARMTA|nr:pyridoxal phosphate-dependent transferase [Desarmillaria tabescens]KAK0459604.1 pyridoxal phosphate-dependent transferase [Desarmillaria tabescens]